MSTATARAFGLKQAAALRRFLSDEEGATAIEYGLIVSLIFLAIVSAVKGFTAETSDMYGEIESSLSAARNP